MRDKLIVDKELLEVFSHIQKIITEQNSSDNIKHDELETLKIIKDSKNHIAGDLNIEDASSEDVFEIVGEVEKTPNENLISIGNLSKTISHEPSSLCVCDICHKGMLFERNLAGLVIDNKFFACEKCCINAAKRDLDIWANSKNAKPEDIRPIAFWLMEKENKTRLIE